MKKLCVLAFLLTGCTAVQHNYVITNTGTIIGLSVAQNPSTQMYEGRFGYARTELALIPTNKGTNDSTVAGTGGAKDTAEVLMEFRMSGIFSFNTSMYQRLAVGPAAVSQPGATLMFSKSANGNSLLTDSSLLQLVLTNKTSK